ncbi:ABC transporter ATP-binding protein [Clostridium subterminale]|uniref:ABC transporter ATP-binding protein n=1 Tax=Clostridium subterminale TaxID=1550 RepID=A0ABN1KVQ9_CLOSU
MIKSLKDTISYIYKISPLYFFLNMLFTLLRGVSSGFLIYATKLLVNTITNTNTQQVVFIRSLFIYATINIAILLISIIFGIVNSKHQLLLDNRMSLDVLNKCVDLELKDFENSDIYDMLGKAQMEGQTKVYLTYKSIMDMLMQITSLLSVISILLTMNSKIFILVIITPLISMFLNYKIGKRNYKMRMARIKNVRKTSYISYLLSNDVSYKEIKMFNLGGYLLDIFSRLKNKLLKQDFEVIKVKSIYDITLGVLEEGISIFVILYIANMTMRGEILIGSMVAYIDSIGTVQSNLNIFLNRIPEIYNNLLYVDQYFKLLNYNNKVNQKEKIAINEIKKIELKNLSYSYNGKNNMVLRNINTTITKGELVGVVGENGSGKSTFIKLICGLYDNYQGEILINDVELKNIDTESLRNKISTVFQDFNKYEFTMRENIAFGNINQLRNDEQIYSILENVELKTKVETYLDRIDTQMGLWFDGEQLSIGQWQKVAIGRALIRDYDLIALDEPTSALDAKSERNIFNVLKEQCLNTIGIYITHRIKNIESTKSRVIVFKDGEIVGDGMHDELIINCTEYRKLLNKDNE